ncbi:response regulator [uncultured Enterovirga sp.]|uniref:response regulator n=1 Tax=uncultured Enterovirga sp. TaxID=2026352 RepID=UPI0035C9850C
MAELLSGRHILVVEDEMMILMMIEDMLADLGCKSMTAVATVSQALAAITHEAFDVAMLDMNLNGDKSHAVAAALMVGRVPFLLSTGYDSCEIGDRYRDRPILRKPFTSGDLAVAMARILEGTPRTSRPGQTATGTACRAPKNFPRKFVRG